MATDNFEETSMMKKANKTYLTYLSFIYEKYITLWCGIKTAHGSEVQLTYPCYVKSGKIVQEKQTFIICFICLYLILVTLFYFYLYVE